MITWTLTVQVQEAGSDRPAVTLPVVPIRDELESLEVNPLRVDGATIEALDAVVTWRSR